MNKIIKILLIFLIFDAVVVGGYFGYKSLFKGSLKSTDSDYEWEIIDENYTPKNFVEEFIKLDSAQKGLFPVSMKNYGKDKSVLRKFRGKNFASPNEARLKMMYKGLEDWMLIDLKYKTEKEREVLRTILYVQINGTWKVGDTGVLAK